MAIAISAPSRYPMQNSGLQSCKRTAWGHSDAGVTLNVYTHASYAHAAEQMAKISQFRQPPEMKKDRDFAVG
ncbi:hypothetical protein V1225_00480 [Emergencia sp. JLR.KK010]|uniref:hypothetical protein n=1 Tax=Emergencia sp. JLR.KK010 TaxID=3114296 RepID=UPI0030CAB5FC